MMTTLRSELCSCRASVRPATVPRAEQQCCLSGDEPLAWSSQWHSHSWGCAKDHLPGRRRRRRPWDSPCSRRSLRRAARQLSDPGLCVWRQAAAGMWSRSRACEAARCWEWQKTAVADAGLTALEFNAGRRGCSSRCGPAVAIRRYRCDVRHRRSEQLLACCHGTMGPQVQVGPIFKGTWPNDPRA